MELHMNQTQTRQYNKLLNDMKIGKRPCMPVDDLKKVCIKAVAKEGWRVREVSENQIGLSHRDLDVIMHIHPYWNNAGVCGQVQFSVGSNSINDRVVLMTYEYYLEWGTKEGLVDALI